jgi:hypothetical protein
MTKTGQWNQIVSTPVNMFTTRRKVATSSSNAIGRGSLMNQTQREWAFHLAPWPEFILAGFSACFG